MSTEETETNVGQPTTEQPSTDSAAANPGARPSQSVATSEIRRRLWPLNVRLLLLKPERARNAACGPHLGKLLDQFEQESRVCRKARLSAVRNRHNRARCGD